MTSHKPIAPSPRWLLLLLLALFSVGCAVTDDADIDGEPVCSSDTDCADNLVCQADRCVNVSQKSLTVAVEVRLPEATEQLTRQFTGLIFEPGLSMPDLQPQTLVPVLVEVTRRTELVPADVRFRAQRSIPGTSVDVWVQAGASSSEVMLLPGKYDVLIDPQPSTGLPRRVYRGVSVETPDVQESVRIELPVVQSEVEERLVSVRGIIKLQYQGMTEPMAAEQVRVYARTEDGEFESQAATICDDGQGCTGSFELFLPPQTAAQTRTYQLVVEPTRENDSIPTIIVDSFDVGADNFVDADGTDQINIDLGTRLAKDIPPFVTVTGTIVSASDESTVSDVLIGAHGTFGDGFEFSTASTTPTGSDGIFELSLPDVDGANLILEVAPLGNSKFASRQFASVDLENLTLKVAQKTRLHGRVNGRTSGDRVSNATVTALPLTGSSLLTSSEMVTETTDESGAFELLLQPGTYDVIIEPTAASGLARQTRRVVVDVDQTMESDFVLGPTSVVFGRVMTALDEPVAGALVDVFAHDAQTDTAVRLGSGETDESGVYRVIVPSPDAFEFDAEPEAEN